MIHARIEGNATSSICHPSLKGQKIVLATPVDDNGEATGLPIAAIDPIGAGLHSTVFISTDGSFTQKTVGDDKSPLRNEVIGIIDETE